MNVVGARRDKGAAVLIMAGGTGGHVFPALAVADMLRARGASVAWLGTRQGLEARVVPEAGFPLHFISVGGLRGKGLAALVLAPVRLMLALAQSLRVIGRVRPRAVLGMGGFVSGPGGLAAWLARRPLLIHEQNAVPGLTNRLLARLACRVMEAFPGSFPARAQARHTGNPVRAGLAAAGRPKTGAGEPLRLLVLGGSLGAMALNRVVPRSLARLGADCPLTVWHQAGPRNLAETRALYAEAGVDGRVIDFIADMAEAYAWADLVLCRAGAMTIAELALVGRGAILVPYPHAVDDHQTRNAGFLAAAGGAILLPQDELDPQRLAALLGELAADHPRLVGMARAAGGLAMPGATDAVAGMCLEVANG